MLKSHFSRGEALLDGGGSLLPLAALSSLALSGVRQPFQTNGSIWKSSLHPTGMEPAPLWVWTAEDIKHNLTKFDEDLTNCVDSHGG